MFRNQDFYLAMLGVVVLGIVIQAVWHLVRWAALWLSTWAA